MNIDLLQTQIESHLRGIERLLGPSYKLTLIATHDGSKGLKDADILLTMATREEILRTIDLFLPPAQATCEDAQITHRQSDSQFPREQPEDSSQRSTLIDSEDTNMKNPSTVAGVLRSRKHPQR